MCNLKILSNKIVLYQFHHIKISLVSFISV
jgi:hypothetical protein